MQIVCATCIYLKCLSYAYTNTALYNKQAATINNTINKMLPHKKKKKIKLTQDPCAGLYIISVYQIYLWHHTISRNYITYDCPICQYVFECSCIEYSMIYLTLSVNRNIIVIADDAYTLSL